MTAVRFTSSNTYPRVERQVLISWSSLERVVILPPHGSQHPVVLAQVGGQGNAAGFPAQTKAIAKSTMENENNKTHTLVSQLKPS